MIYTGPSIPMIHWHFKCRISDGVKGIYWYWLYKKTFENPISNALTWFMCPTDRPDAHQNTETTEGHFFTIPIWKKRTFLPSVVSNKYFAELEKYLWCRWYRSCRWCRWCWCPNRNAGGTGGVSKGDKSTSCHLYWVRHIRRCHCVGHLYVKGKRLKRLNIWNIECYTLTGLNTVHDKKEGNLGWLIWHICCELNRRRWWSRRKGCTIKDEYFINKGLVLIFRESKRGTRRPCWKTWPFTCVFVVDVQTHVVGQ